MIRRPSRSDRLMPELRFDVLREEWVAYNTERNDRTFLPTTFCPLCPSGSDGATELPVDDFQIAVFENRFPALDRSTRGQCEVIVYTPQHTLTLAQLPVERIRLLVDVWADRYLALGARSSIEYVYIFENKGEQIGVTLHHPHGQIYALPFIPPVAARELEAARRHMEQTGRCLHCEVVAREQAGARRLIEAGSVSAFVPLAARWPYEVHVYPRRHVGSIAELDGTERDDLARALNRVTVGYDRHFGFSTPYVMAMHQAPTDGNAWPQAHLHIEFYPPHRRSDRLKLLAGVELGAGTFVNDTRPEETAASLREAMA